MVADALIRQIQGVQFTDLEINRLAQNAAGEARKVMKRLDAAGTTSSAVRSAQVSLAKINIEYWDSVKGATQIGIGDAVWNATEAAALFDEAMFSAAGVSSTYWRQSMIATAQEGVQNLISRKENGITLSQRVYKNGLVMNGTLDKAINNGLALGKSVAEISKDVIGFIDPATPGGASYAANRLARSEVLNAYHTTSINKAKEAPWVEFVVWHLSGSHPRPDECNEYAENHAAPKAPAGSWRPSDVPAKPHPNCLCYIEPVSMSPQAFAKAYNNGKFDTYIDQTMGCYRVA